MNIQTFDDFRICITDHGCAGCSREDFCKGLRNNASVEISKLLALDVLNMLKPVKPVLSMTMWECGNCGHPMGILHDDVRNDFCPKCGKPADWTGIQ